MRIIAKIDGVAKKKLSKYLTDKFNGLDISIFPQIGDTIVIAKEGKNNDYKYKVIDRNHFFDLSSKYYLILYLDKP